MPWTKGDGMLIKATFDRALIGNRSGNEGHFRVYADEYDYTPGGTIHPDQEKAVASTSAGTEDTEVLIHMEDSFRNTVPSGPTPVSVSGPVAGTDRGMPGVAVRDALVRIYPYQSGSGDPSPANVRPISGITGLTVMLSKADTSSPTTYPVTWQTAAGTVYGGTLDLETGLLTVTHIMVDMGTLTWTLGSQTTENYFRATVGNRKYGTDASGIVGRCSSYKWWGNGSTSGLRNGLADHEFGFQTTTTHVWVRDDTYGSDVQAFKSATSGVKLVFERSSALTYQLDPVTIRQLAGSNRLWVAEDDNAALDSCTFVNAARPGLRVTYDGAGSLHGEGGGVSAFDVTFIPDGLEPKNNQNDPEHLEISGISATGTLTDISYTDTQEREHVGIAAVTATGVLTDVHDL